MQKTTQLKIADYDKEPFDHQTWNCLHLAKRLHDDYYGIPNRFPEIDKFSHIHQDEVTAAIEVWVPMYCRRIFELSNGCVVVLVSEGDKNLGSYFDGLIYYMGNQGAEAHPPRKLSRFIASIWEIC